MLAMLSIITFTSDFIEQWLGFNEIFWRNGLDVFIQAFFICTRLYNLMIAFITL